MAGPLRVTAVLAALLATAGCATTYAPRPLEAPAELRDVQSRSIGEVTVSVSILTDEQAREHFGADFGKHELQALWMSVRNGSNRRLWFIRNVLDMDFYSAEEAALMLAPEVPRYARDRLRQHLRDESMRAQLRRMGEERGFSLVSCCSPGFAKWGIPATACVDGGMLRRLFPGAGIPDGARPTRPGCLCSPSRDIGEYRTCRHGCRYCYAA